MIAIWMGFVVGYFRNGNGNRHKLVAGRAWEVQLVNWASLDDVSCWWHGMFSKHPVKWSQMQLLSAFTLFVDRRTW